MRALVLEDWWRLVVAHRPDPVPGENDVLIEVVATGICGSDLHGYTGENGRRQHGQVMGHETVGHVASLGPGVDTALGFAVGDLATVNPIIGCGQCGPCVGGNAQACVDKTVIGVTPGRPAAFAELLAVPAENVVALPPDIPVEYGALVEPLSVGYHAVRRAPVRPGDAVLVVGGGPIGQACVLAAGREGARAVAVSEVEPERRELIGSLGACCVDPAEGDLPSLVARQLDGPPDVVVDAVGSDRSLQDCLTCAPPGAPVVLVGMAMPHLTVPAYEISTQERSLVGSFCYTAAEFRDTARWAGTAPPELTRLIDGRVDLDGAPAAFDRLARGDWAASKVLVRP